ncbi:MAG: PIN domain-containing protein [Spirochaetia bacterium]
MNKVLVDTSIWIEYFKSSKKHTSLEPLIMDNQICINDLILTEILPFLQMKNEFELIEALQSIEKVQININWNLIQQMQIDNLRNGINKVGLSDLIILQNVIDNNLILYSIDKHFNLMNEIFKFQMFNE